MLGRSQNLEDIRIVETECKFDPSGIKVCPAALAESNRISDAFKTIKAAEELQWSEHFTISYLNVRRLIPNLRHVKADHILMKSNAIALAETWLAESENVQLDGYEECLLNGGNGKGIAAYIENGCNPTWQRFSNDKTSAILMQMPQLDVVYLYLSQGFDYDPLKDQLDKWIKPNRMVAIIGDVNFNYLDQNHKLKSYLQKKKFNQLVKSATHELGSLLDQIYVNEKLMSVKPFASQRSVYFSDHDVIVLHIPKKYM